MKKIARQLTSASTPPSKGAHEEAIAPPMAETATARARGTGSGYAWLISAIDDGMISAAAAPCTNRAATSTVIVGAQPQVRDATTNAAMPTPKARRAPMRADIAPDDSSSAANSSV